MLPYTTEANVIKIVNEKLKESGVTPSKDEIISIVNEAIESGEIEVGGSGTNLDINLANYCTNENLLALVGCVTGDSPSYPFGQTISFSEGISIDYDNIDKVTLYFDIPVGEDETLSAKAILYKSSLIHATSSGASVEVRGYFGAFSFNSGERNVVSYLQLGTSFDTSDFNHLEYVSITPKEVVPVIANPEVDGSELPLNGLQVGNTKYTVGGGNTFDYLDIIFNDKNNNNCNMRMIGLYKEYFERQESIALFNGLITQLNNTFSTNIPSFTKFEDLYEITSYIYGLDNTTYELLKDMFFINLFQGISFFTLSIQVLRGSSGTSMSGSIISFYDQEGVDTIFSIDAVNPSLHSVQTLCSFPAENYVLNFKFWVNDLD